MGVALVTVAVTFLAAVTIKRLGFAPEQHVLLLALHRAITEVADLGVLSDNACFRKPPFLSTKCLGDN